MYRLCNAILTNLHAIKLIIPATARSQTYSVNGWDKSIVDPDPQKKYTLGTELAASQSKQADDDCKLGAR